jgi:hypothetical protein
MFRKRLAFIESDEGFAVRALGRAGLEYREGEKIMRVDSEMLVGPAGLVLYKASIRSWEPPHDREVVDDAGRDRIVDNIRRAFRFEGFEIEVE